MFDSFSTALTGLKATSSAVNIVGNNLANLNTVGYKALSAEFADLMNQELGLSTLGVAPVEAVRHFTQGAVQQTSGPLDAAIQGDGLFVLRNQKNQQVYTRAGNFTIDATGHLLTQSGENVQGWNATAGVVNASAGIGDIVVPVNGAMPAVATTSMSMTVNLDATATVGAASGTYSAPIQVIDSLGATHTLTITFTKTGANAWKYDITIPPGDLKSPSTTPLATGNLTFSSSGDLTSPASTAAPIAINVSGLADGAANMTVNWNLFNNGNGLVTQFGQPSGVSATTQDGVPAGQVTQVGIGDGGMILAHYSNGQQTTVGQLALASFQNPDSLLAVGNNDFMAAAATSAPAIGTANTGGRGAIMGSALESSTVDIATEFTNLITFQRSYQANSRVITTTDQMTQDLIGLIR